MKVRSNRIETTPRLMILPMIDVIFFLLVFFMYSSLQALQQSQLSVQLPPAARAPAQTPEKPLAVVLQASGQIALEEECVSLAELPERVRSRLARGGAAAAVLRADEAAPHGKVVAVMDALRSAGVRKLSIAARGPAS